MKSENSVTIDASDLSVLSSWQISSGKSTKGIRAIATTTEELVERVPRVSQAVATGTFAPGIPKTWQRKSGRALNMIESFYHAFHGIWVGLKEERNVRIHFLAAVAVTALAIWLKIDTLGCIALTFAVGLVLITEFLNTSLEHLVNINSGNEYHKSARYAKDTAAAAVLCASVTSFIVGLIVFMPPLYALVQSSH